MRQTNPFYASLTPLTRIPSPKMASFSARRPPTFRNCLSAQVPLFMLNGRLLTGAVLMTLRGCDDFALWYQDVVAWLCQSFDGSPIATKLECDVSIA